MENTLCNFGMWEDANLLVFSGIGLAGDSLNEAAVIIFSALKDSLKMKKKNKSQRRINYTFVESDILVNSSKMCAGGSEFNSKKITSPVQEVHILILFLMCAEETQFY